MKRKGTWKWIAGAAAAVVAAGLLVWVFLPGKENANEARAREFFLEAMGPLAKGDLEVWLDHEDPYGYQFYHAVETVNGLETGTKGYLTMEPNGTLSAPPHIVEGNYEAVADKTLDDFIGEDEAKELALKEFTEKAEILDRIPEEELKLVEAKLVNDGGLMYWQVSFENEDRLLTVSLRAENGDVKAVFTEPLQQAAR